LIFANEFFDALPFHLLKRGKKGWEELLVVMADHRLHFVSGELSNPILASYASEFGGAIPVGGILEVCLGLEDWCVRIATLLTDGKLLVIDYGYELRELLRFPTGTLLTFNQHRTGIDPLLNPATADITAHVNFTWLRNAAAKAGLRCTNSSTLSNWVLSIWGEQDLQQKWATADQRWKLQWKNLVFGLGETFKVLEFEH
jgi:SAM-dependent MidA family methyltransferase